MKHLTVSLPDDVAARLLREAESREISLEEFAVQRLIEAATPGQIEPPGETVQQFLARHPIPEATPSIDPITFFQEIRMTKGFPTKEDAQRHLSSMRDEWA